MKRIDELGQPALVVSNIEHLGAERLGCVGLSPGCPQIESLEHLHFSIRRAAHYREHRPTGTSKPRVERLPQLAGEAFELCEGAPRR